MIHGGPSRLPGTARPSFPGCAGESLITLMPHTVPASDAQRVVRRRTADRAV